MLIEMAQKGFIAEKKFEGLTANSVQSYHNLFKVWNDWLASEKVEHIEELSSRIAKKFLLWCQEVNENKPYTTK